MSINLIQQLNTVSNPNGVGIPVTQYVTEMQAALTAQLTTEPKNQLTQLNTSQTALTALQTALQTYQQATYTLTSSQSWNSVTATSSDPSSFTVTTSPGAQPSNYSLQVNSLAKNQFDIQNLSSQYQTTESGASNFIAGTVVITPDTINSGQPTTINVTAGESLDSIVSSINGQTAATGVQASVINNGQGQYLLSMSSAQTGTANGFSLSGSLIGSGSGQIQMSTSSATDAQITVDGQVLTSSTNTFQNLIPNVTIQVSQTMSTAGTMTLATDSSSAEKSVQTWMDAYNTLIDLVHQDTAYTPASSTSSNSQSSGTAGPLFNDPNANGLLTQLPGNLNQTFSTSDSSISSLATIGIVTDPQTGHLEFQPSSGFSFSGTSSSVTLQDGKTMFENAFNSDPTAVQQLFGVVQTTSSTAIPVPGKGLLAALNSTLQTFLYGSGSGTSPIQGDLDSITAQQNNINSYLDMINKQITSQIANYTDQLNALNSVMQQSQSQMQQLSALFSGSSTSSSSSGSIA